MKETAITCIIETYIRDKHSYIREKHSYHRLKKSSSSKTLISYIRETALTFIYERERFIYERETLISEMRKTLIINYGNI